MNAADDGYGGRLTQGLGFGHQPLNTFRTNLRANTLARVLQKIQAGEVRNFYFDGEAVYHPNPSALPLGDLQGYGNVEVAYPTNLNGC